MPERLKKFGPDGLTPEQSEIYDYYVGLGSRPRSLPLMDDEGHLLGPVNAWLVSPRLGLAFDMLGRAVRRATDLSPAAQEIIILVVAQRVRSEFERAVHEPSAESSGVPRADIERLSNGEPVSFDDPEWQACYELAVALINNSDLTDAEYARGVAALGEKRVFEVVGIVGWYQMIAMQLAVYQVMPPEPTS
jgi:4-carboxymuconolactone decarboxylase